MGPIHWIHGWGLVYGIYPCHDSLGQHTGDGKYDGETFLGRTWMFFLGGVGEGIGTPGRVLLRRDASSKHPWVYFIYYMSQ